MKLGRIIISLLLVALLNTYAFASNVETFGEKLTISEITEISEILAAPEQFVGKKVLVQRAWLLMYVPSVAAGCILPVINHLKKSRSKSWME
jgi:hypothetical protein